MRINLAYFETLPTLVNGKVIVLNCPYGKHIGSVNGKSVSLITVGKYTTVPDGDIKAEHYDILQTSQYTILVNSKDGFYFKVVKDYLDNQEVSHIRELLFKYSNPVTYRVGDNVHLKHMNGIYKIDSIHGSFVSITCQKWQRYPEQHSRYKFITLDDIKCLAGGIHNWNR